MIRLLAAFALGLVLMAAPVARAAELLEEPQVGDNGLHAQSWFVNSFLDLGEDLAEAKAAGKGLVVIFEQAGCPYCREMHQVNFRRADIVDLVRANFNVVQIDLRGSRSVTDMDGEAMEERALARKWGVAFTPTLMFFAKDADPAGKPGNQAVAAVMPGYFKPFHFASMFDYVASDSYRHAHFQDYIVERRERLRAAGQDVTLWE
ncbi:MAG: thioredoxin family protein [Rhizobiaceae bacterium]